MKSWMSVVWLGTGFAVMLGARHLYRDRVVHWAARRAGRTAATARVRALACHGAVFLLAAALIVAGVLAWRVGGAVALLRYPAALIVLIGYTPLAALGAPKLTKWQKNHEQRLVDAGAARAAARGWDSVARVFSVLGVVAGFAAVFLLVVPN